MTGGKLIEEQTAAVSTAGYHILYNPLAGNGESGLETLEQLLAGEVVGKTDITTITDYSAFLTENPACSIVICGGDGTLNRFINDTAELEPQNELWYYATGSGNDFLRDLNVSGRGPVRVDEYLKDLPVCEVNGKKYRFFNGVGYGLDGYICAEGDRLRRKTGKKINYTMIAIKGVLFCYKPTRAVITVDGVTHTYDKVWMTPTMKGRFVGGGMMLTPNQDRSDPGRAVSSLIYHKAGKLRTMSVLPSVFTGGHLKYTDIVEVLVGHSIQVKFDRPVALQIDGEPMLGVQEYSISSGR